MNPSSRLQSRSANVVQHHVKQIIGRTYIYEKKDYLDGEVCPHIWLTFEIQLLHSIGNILTSFVELKIKSKIIISNSTNLHFSTCRFKPIIRVLTCNSHSYTMTFWSSGFCLIKIKWSCSNRSFPPSIISSTMLYPIKASDF